VEVQQKVIYGIRTRDLAIPALNIKRPLVHHIKQRRYQKRPSLTFKIISATANFRHNHCLEKLPSIDLAR